MTHPHDILSFYIKLIHKQSKLYKIMSKKHNSNNAETQHLNIAGVMTSFLEMKAKEHTCNPSELNIGYYEGEAFLYKTYHDKYHETKVAWEQDLITGEITF